MALFGKKGLKYFICYKDGKTFDEIGYILFLIKRINYQQNIMEFGRKSAIASKKELIVKLYTMKNI